MRFATWRLASMGLIICIPLVAGALFEGGSDAPPAVAEVKRPAMRTVGYLADVRLRRLDDAFAGPPFWRVS